MRRAKRRNRQDLILVMDDDGAVNGPFCLRLEGDLVQLETPRRGRAGA